MRPTVKETLAAIRALGLPAARISETGEYRVGPASRAYYTTDAADAIATARDIVARANAASEAAGERILSELRGPARLAPQAVAFAARAHAAQRCAILYADAVALRRAFMQGAREAKARGRVFADYVSLARVESRRARAQLRAFAEVR